MELVLERSFCFATQLTLLHLGAVSELPSSWACAAAVARPGVDGDAGSHWRAGRDGGGGRGAAGSHA